MIPIYMSYLEQSNSYKQKVEEWLLGTHDWGEGVEGGRGGVGRIRIYWCRVSVWNDEKVPETDGGDGCAIM